MALPGNMSLVWVRGTFLNLDGSAMTGRITFSANVVGGALVNPTAKRIIGASPFSGTLDANTGYFQVQLPATNDPDVTPVGFTYSVVEPTGRKYSITVPFDAPALDSPGDPLHGQQVIELSDIVPAPGASGGTAQLLRGRGVASMDVDGANHLVVTYSDATTEDLGVLPGGALANMDDLDVTGAAVGAVLTATEVSPLAFGLVAPRVFDISHYGAVRSMRIDDASMTAASAVLSSSSYSFTTDDVGKVVGVRGAGVVSTDFETVANDGVLVATIASVSGGDATLSAAAVTSCSGVPAVFGTPIDEALTAAITAASTAGGGTVYFPAGVWIAQSRQTAPTRVAYTGAGRGNSVVYVVKLGTGSGPTTPWLSAPGGFSYYKDEVNLSDFTCDGQFFAATDAYGFDMKMIQIAYTSNSTVERMAVLNNPATAIGYDESINCLIANNVIVNPGRLATAAAPNGSPGGSGIGLAAGFQGPLSMVIRNNFVSGLWTPAGGTGRTGILIESSSSTTAPASYGGGVKIVDNFVEGFFNGILDCGATDTAIHGNTLRGCQNGIKLGTNGISTGFIGRDTTVIGNHIESGGGLAAPDIGAGILITSTSSTVDSEARTLVEGNIVRNVDGFGILVNSTAQVLNHVNIRGNAIRDNTRNGIRVVGTVRDLAITDNSISGNGSSGVAGAIQAINVTSGTSWTGGRLEGNDFYDFAAIPTQTNTYVTTGATLVGVRVAGNTGDVSDTGNQYTRKTSTTTMTNTTTVATVSAFSLNLVAGTTYELDALIEYTTTVAAGAKLAWVVPSGTSLSWTVDAPGAPSTMGGSGVPGQLVVGGVDGATSIVARARGVVVVGATAGTLTLQTAQAAATADTLTITTKTNMELRKVA